MNTKPTISDADFRNTISDAVFQKIERELECPLTEQDREHIRFTHIMAETLSRQQKDLELDIYPIADDLVKYGAAVAQSLLRASRSAHIAHWLCKLGGLEPHVVDEGGFRADIYLKSMATYIRMLRQGAKHIQSIPGRRRGTSVKVDRNATVKFLAKVLTKLKSWGARIPTARFAKALWPYLPSPARCRSADALADALNLVLNTTRPSRSQKKPN